MQVLKRWPAKAPRSALQKNLPKLIVLGVGIVIVGIKAFKSAR